MMVVGLEVTTEAPSFFSVGGVADGCAGGGDGASEIRRWGRCLQGCGVSNCRTQPQLYKTGRTGGQEPVGGECVSVT